MLILDFHQVMISNIMVNLTTNRKNEIEEDLVRHMILNSVRNINTKFKEEYGKLVVAYDSKKSWRKGVFPYYKANRKKAQKESPVDWIKLFDFFGRIKPELKDVLPYKVIEVEGCEADDIIATLTRFARDNEKVLIVSGDKDFIQLHGENVQQYDPVKKTHIKTPEWPALFLFEHIVRGDSGDGIPNILSDDDTFVVEGKRQTPVTKKKIDSIQAFWWRQNPRYGIEDCIHYRNWKRNEQLIDLAKTPEELIIKVMEEYANFPQRDKRSLYNYLVRNKCNNLLEAINDF